MGAMVDKTQMDRVLGYIETGKKEGAKLVLGGKRVRDETGGYYVEPTVFDGVDNKMKIAQEEIFGPVLSTITFKTPEEAVQDRQRHDLWPRRRGLDPRHQQGLQDRHGRCAPASVWVNCFDGGDITAPFGGFKQSGIGRDKSLHALDKYTELKTTWINIGA